MGTMGTKEVDATVAYVGTSATGMIGEGLVRPETETALDLSFISRASKDETLLAHVNMDSVLSETENRRSKY